MKMICPSCKTVVLPEHVSLKKDMAVCAQCNKEFKISESVLQALINAGSLPNPPADTWFRREANKVVVGASARSLFAAFFFVPFMLLWSGVLFGIICGIQITSGEFSLVVSLAGIPFLLGGAFFWKIVLMMCFGKVEVTIAEVSSVFIGIGSLGRRRVFDWSAIKSIREEKTPVQPRNSTKKNTHIVMDGKERLSFGENLNDAQLYFLLIALKLVKSESASRFDREVAGVRR